MFEPLIDMVAGMSPMEAVRAAAEIALLTYLIYQLFRELRGGRTVPIAFGALLLVGAYYLAALLGFTTIESLLAALTPYIGLTFIILFQALLIYSH